MDNKLKGRISNFLKITKKQKIIKEIQQDLYHHNDEPRIPSFIIELGYKSFSTYGFTEERFKRYSSFYKEKCLLKALGETIERYCLNIYFKKNFIWDSYKHLKKKAINPKKFISFSKFKTKPLFKIYKDNSEKLNWVKAFSLNNNKNIFVPA